MRAGGSNACRMVPFATSRRTARTSWSRRPTAGRSRSRRTYSWASYKLWAEDHNLRTRHWPNKQLFKWLLPLLPDSQEVRPRTGGRKRLVVLPSLQACRDAYDQHIGQPVDWEVIEDAAEDGFGEYAREARSRYG